MENSAVKWSFDEIYKINAIMFTFARFPFALYKSATKVDETRRGKTSSKPK